VEPRKRKRRYNKEGSAEVKMRGKLRGVCHFQDKCDLWSNTTGIPSQYYGTYNY